MSTWRMVATAGLAAITVISAPGSLQAQHEARAPRALDEMVATERAFAKLGAEVGARDSFLRYFSDEAISLDGEPRPAKDEIRQWPAPTPGSKLLWEPRLGDIASSGDLGYLTGPVVQVAADGTRRHSCYLSVWKRQVDGTFKVAMDFGVATPAAAAFSPGFTRGWRASRDAGRAGIQEARASLEAAERTLAERSNTQAAAAAFSDVVIEDTRVYRQALMPVAGTAAIARWLATQPPMHDMTIGRVDVAATGDLGYAWGNYTTSTPGGTGARGHFLHVWGRDARGRWHLLVDAAHPIAP